MTFFQEVYDRIRCATNARTQTELAAVLEIRQSSISDAKRRNSIPSDWYMKLFEKFGLNPDWIKSGTGPMFLKIDQVYTPVEGPPEGFHEEPAHYADPNAISTLTKVYSTQCAYEEGHPAPDLQTSGKIALPQSYVGVDTSRTHPISGEVYAVYMPHEGVALKRLFLDGDHDRFILRTEQPAHPGVALLPQDCPGRILGRVSWVLQNV